MRPPSSARHPARRFVPRVENLETRCLLSAVVTESAGVLRVVGNNRRDVIEILDNGGTAPGSVTVICNGRTTTSSGPIGDIRVNTNGGNDVVIYGLTGSLAQHLTRGLHIDTGAGNDRFTAFLATGLQAKSFLDLNVNTGPGDDVIQVNAPANVDVPAGATLRIFLQGGDDADRLGIHYEGQVQGRLLSRAEGNPGMDQLLGDYHFAPGSTGFAAAELRGGTNIDHLQLYMRKDNPADPLTISGLIDG